MSGDLTPFLASWAYDPDNTLRIVAAEDGRQVLQVRLPLGVEQYELDGRPDGARPFEKESFVEEVEDRVAAHVSHYGSDSEFELGHDDATALHTEGLLFYYRYLLLFQLNDFARVARDTGHNLKLCRLLERYCSDDNDRNAVLQFKPYILRMNAMARAMLSIQNQVRDVAQTVLTKAIQEIESLEEIESPAFQFERIRSINYLRSALRQIDEQASGPINELEAELQKAVDDENYERAAEIRDRLRRMGDSP